MKNAHNHGIKIVLFFLIIACTNLHAQQSASSSQKSKTKLESFQRQTGTVIIKGYSEIGTILADNGSVEVDCMEFADATTGKRQMGILIKVKESGRVSERSFVDYDEVESLLKGIDYISKVKANATRLGKFEAIYKTKGDFNVTTFGSSSGMIEAAVKSGYILPATVYMSLQRFAKVHALILQAKQKLDSLK